MLLGFAGFYPGFDRVRQVQKNASVAILAFKFWCLSLDYQRRHPLLDVHG